MPENAIGMGATPYWIGHVEVDDVDATVDQIKRLGGVVHVPPTEVLNISRFSVVADPQTATLTLVKGLKPAQARSAELGTPGRVGWHELLAADWEKAFAFYGELFGWQKANAHVGAMGTYQQFSAGGETIGGMFTKPATLPFPFWLYYFNISDIEAAAKRVEAGGGQILYGPTEVPGGAWIIHCTDPQGAVFALLDRRSRKTIGYFISSASHRDLPDIRGRRGSWQTPRLQINRYCPAGLGRAIVMRKPPISRRDRSQIDRRALHVELNPGHLCEQIDIGDPDIGDPDRTSAKPHFGRHQVERLSQYSDILQNERICNRAVLP
jgi:predicted enzyme related to lactoylglutathione lyase